MRDYSHWMPTKLVGVLYQLKCCDKGIDKWQSYVGPLVVGYRKDQLAYFYGMRELYLDALN